MRFARVASCMVWVSLAGVAALPGCGLFGSGRDKNAPLIAAANSPIADVPIPAGYTMTSDSTSKVVPNSLRFVDHRYQGTDDVLPVVKFYRDKMPENGWNWVDQNQSRGSEMGLHFSKRNEECYITITPGNLGRTYIRVKIDPVGRDAAK